MPSATPFVLGVFQSISPQAALSGASWLHPENTAIDYLNISYWTSMAEKLESANLDFLFLADSYGLPTVNGDVPDYAIREAIQLPTGDPFTIVSAIAAVTSSLGLVVTSSTVFEPAHASARRFATLDHFTRGRMGWNVVTGAGAASASALFGQEMIAHDTRYDMADDYLDVSYRFLEGSWEEGAVVRDRARRTYAEPSMLHRVDHDGPYVSAHGQFSVEPSPQRMPTIFQAGSSGRGREFAAMHAECVFLQGTTVPKVADSVDDIRTRAVAHGRTRDAIRILVGLTIITAPTREEAERRYAEFQSFSTDETAAAQYAHNTGIDLLALDPDLPLPAVGAEQGRTNVERFQGSDAAPAPTVREILDEMKRRGLRGLVLVGTPEEVADEMEAYADATGIDGYLLEPYLVPGTYDDLIDLVLPVLRERGRAPLPSTAPTLRERLFPAGTAHLPDDHPGAAYRATPASVPTPASEETSR